MRLLLVEPDSRLAERLQESLESEGYVVDLVGSLSAARRAVGRADYAAVFMDIHDPDAASPPASRRVPGTARESPDPDDSPGVNHWFG